jgi:hypothetical protein
MPEASIPVSLLRMAGFAALAVVAFTVGIRMLRLWRRTGQLPELALGSHILLLIAGYGLEFAGLVGEAALGPRGAWICRAAGNLCYAACIVSYLVFNWRVFRPGSRVAGAAVGVGVAALAVGWTGEFRTSLFELTPERFAEPWFWIGYSARIGTMVWASSEGLLAWRRAARRHNLGLESALVVNRFLTWGLAAAAEVAIYFVAGHALLGSDPAAFLAGTHALLISAMGCMAAITITLAFQPPEMWRRFIEGRGAA